MKKILAIIIGSILLFSPVLISEPTPVKFLHVGEGQEYATIQEAVDVAEDGNTIIVHDGIYNENVQVVNKRLFFRGNSYYTEEDDNVTIMGLSIKEKGCHIYDFFIKTALIENVHDNNSWSINVEDCIIGTLVIDNCSASIHISNNMFPSNISSQALIVNNSKNYVTIQGNIINIPVFVMESKGISINENTIYLPYNNLMTVGLLLAYSDVYVDNNTIQHTGQGLTIIDPIWCTIVNNNFTDNFRDCIFYCHLNGFNLPRLYFAWNTFDKPLPNTIFGWLYLFKTGPIRIPWIEINQV